MQYLRMCQQLQHEMCVCVCTVVCIIISKTQHVQYKPGFLSGGGKGEHMPPLGSVLPPLGTGRFVNDNSGLIYMYVWLVLWMTQAYVYINE